MSDVARVASWLRGARAVVVITGAGISAESGVPTFRGADGLWRSFRPEDLATPQAFAGAPRALNNTERVARAVGPALPTCSSCGAILRPGVVWFGEALDGNAVDRAIDAIHGCDVLLLAGTLTAIEAAL